MKIFHTSDWHLGRMLYGRSLLEDQAHFIDQVFLPAVERERPAAVLIAGDVYDRQVAPTEAIRLFDRCLNRLLELGCQAVVISGNHDGADRMALLKGVLKKSGAHFATEISDAFSPVLLEAEGLWAQIFPLPFADTAQVRDFLGDPELRGEGACMAALIERMQPLFRPGAAHILISHCFAAGAVPSDSESGTFVGGAGQVPPALFDAFDYCALGHLHAPQRAGEKGRYSGSPLKYSVDEERQKKGYVILGWDGKALSTRVEKVTPLRDVRRVRGLFSDLLEGEPCGDYVELTLTDNAPVFQAAERLRSRWPNLLSVVNSWAVSKAAGQRAERLRGQSDGTVFASFLKEICGVEPDEEDKALFSALMEEVRP